MPKEPPMSLAITRTFASGMPRWREKMSCIMCGACVGLVDPTGVEFAPEAHVVAELGMDDLFPLQGLFHVDYDGQLFPVGLDELHRVLGLRARLRDHRSDCLALPA